MSISFVKHYISFLYFKSIYSIWFNYRGSLLLIPFLILSCSKNDQTNFKTKYLDVGLNGQGRIYSLKDITKQQARELSPSDKKSSLLSLYNSKLDTIYESQSAVYNKFENTIKLTYPNNSVAEIKVEPKDKYLKFTLLSLTNREDIEGVQWGSIHTNITNLFGEIIGVARDTSETINYALGMLALNDNTLGGTSRTIADAAPFQYVIHSPDTIQYPLPNDLHEGQVFTLGGNGISDVAFYAHKEPYYRIVYGNAAEVDDKGRISITYNSRDRSKKREVYFSLIPNMPANIPNHIDVEPIPEVDYIGSSVALWGGPDHTALMDVIQDIVKEENLPYPTIKDKWVKDPTAFVPDVLTYGNLYDSIISYTHQLGFKTISLYDQGFVRADRGNKGYLDGFNFEKKPIRLTAGNVSHKEYADMAAKYGITIGRTPITTALAPGTKDASPIPSDSLCYQQKRLLVKGISPTDTIIIVDYPKYMDEIASWEGHAENLNMIKIGKELIHYLGISQEEPYRLLNVKRGYWGTTPSNHQENDTIYKLQVTINYGYDGLIPNLALQDEIAEYYADVCKINGLGYYDFDGQEFLFNNGHGYYSVKRFFGKMFNKAKEYGLPSIRFTGATLSEGSWHYQSIWNVGGGTNLYDLDTREWGSSTSQGKDLRDVTYANFFPVGVGGNFPITASSTVEQYEHIMAISCGIGMTFSLKLNQNDVESCPQKYDIFKVIRTWQEAREANAFPRDIKKLLVKPDRDWQLEKVDDNNWDLFPITNNTRGAVIKLSRGD